MKVRFVKKFPDYPSADAWIESNRYTESVFVQSSNGSWTVTLEGEHAVRAIEAEANAKVIVPREAA